MGLDWFNEGAAEAAQMTDVFDSFVEEMWGAQLGPTEDLAVASLGLAGEYAEGFEKLLVMVLGSIAVGKVSEHEKKVIRGDDSKKTDEAREELKKELGDSLFYIVKQGQLNGFTLNDIIEANMHKIIDRRERLGTYRGSGDNR